MRKFFMLVIGMLLATSMSAQTDNIIGVWLTEDKEAQVEIFKSNNLYVGKIIWLREPNNPRTGKPWLDDKNKDAKKRVLPLIGSFMLWDFKYDDKEYVGGKVYDSRDGKTYAGKLWLTNKNTLKMRGYVGFFYSTETWIKVR